MLRPSIDITTDVLKRRVLDVGSLFLICAVVGVVTGLGAAAFQFLLQLAKHAFLDGLAGYRPPGPPGEPAIFSPTTMPFSRIALFFLPAAGGLASALLVYFFAPEAEGHGTDAAIDAYHHHDGAIRARIPLVKAVTAALTMGSGGSAGREGPIAQIGAGLGSILALKLGLSTSQRRILLAAGLGAGIGAIFRAPLAGALFAAEVLYREMDLEYEVIAPAILSSIIAYSTFGFFYGWQPLFDTPEFAFRDPRELLPFLPLALVVALGGRLYVQVFYGVRDLFRTFRLPAWLRPALGGIAVGAIGLALPQALSTGFGVLQDAFWNKASALLLLAIAGGKILATAFTVGSGGSGGVFGPAVVIGGSLGGATGLLFHDWWPRLAPEPAAFAVVGMAGFFSAAAHVPISTVIMVSEMTGNHGLLVPSMFVSLIAFLLVRRHTIYENQLPLREDSPAHQRRMIRTVLERIRIRDILTLRRPSPPEPIADSTPLAEILDRFAATDHTCLPVVNAEGALTGSVTLDMVRHALESAAKLDLLVVAKDVALPPITVTPGQSALDALGLMIANHRTEILVMDAEQGGRVIDILTSTEINAFQNSPGPKKG